MSEANGNQAQSSFTSKELRETLGLFPTGVAIITARVDGCPIGATVSSFNSVSLEPPLVLFSIAKSAAALPAWQKATEYAINLLGEDQSALSNRFAKAMTDKWDGIEPVQAQAISAPLLPDVLGWLECESYAQYEGGDHIIFVGRVVALRKGPHQSARPLIFFGSRYRQLDREQHA
jgi:flavin reductase (DIM6/NTAB) family NADH-FMN oxidoreductase RutF